MDRPAEPAAQAGTPAQAHLSRLPAGVSGHVWHGAKRSTTAVVVALFPFLFILDGPIDGMSPVLPGMIFLIVVMAFAPMTLAEWKARSLRKQEAPERRAAVWSRRARHARSLAWTWVVAWFLLGM